MKLVFQSGLVVAVLALFLFTAPGANASACVSAATGNWSATGTWTGCGGTGIPVAADSVEIRGGFTVTVDVSNAVAASIQVGGNPGAGSGTLVFNSGSQVTVSGSVTLGSSITAGNNGTITMTSGGTLSAGSLALGTLSAKTWTPGTGTVVLTATNGLPATIFTSFNNLTITTGTTTLAVGIAVNGTLTQSGGNIAVATFTLTINGTHAAGTNTVSGGGGYTLASAATLQSGSTTGVNGNITTTTKTLNTAANYTFNGSLAQGTGAAMPATVNNLIINNAAGVTLSQTTATSGTLAVTTGTFTIGAFTYSVTGATTVSGTLSITSTTGTKTFTGNVTINNGGTWNNSANEIIAFGGSLQNDGTFTAGTAVHTFSGTAQTISGANAIAIPSLTISGTTTNNGTLTVSTTLAGASTLTNGANATLNVGDSAPTPTLTATANPNTVNYNGGGAQTIKATTYHHLTLSNAGAKTAGGALTVNGDLTLSGTATFAGGTSLTHTFLGNWVVNTTAATPFSFTAASTLNFNTPSAAAATSISGASAATLGFNSVTVNNTSGFSSSLNFNITGTQTISANATFTPSAGVVINAAAAQGTITGSGAVKVTRTAATADYSSQYKFSTNTLSGLTVEYAGSGAQTIAALSYGSLKINNSSGTTLAGNATVNGTLTFTSGNITTSSNSFSISSTGSVSRTSGHVVGNFKKFIATGPTSMTFEVGDASNYTPVLVSFASVTTGGDLTASDLSGDHANLGTSNIDVLKSVNRNWTLANGGIVFTNYDATFTFVAGDVDGSASTGTFIVGKYSGGSWTYPTVGTRTTTSTQATALSAFGDFQVGNISTYTISGHIQNASSVAISGVTVTLSGGQAGTTTTDSNGDYSLIAVVGGGDYAVTPSLTNYTFNPTSLSYTSLAATQTAQNFTGAITKTWDGGASTANWGDASNWNPDGVPVSVNNVDLSGANTININVAAVANNVTLNNASLVLTVNSGNSLTVLGNLTLASGALKTAAAFPTVTGTVNVAGGTVEFTGSGTQTIPAYSYNNLTSSSAGARTLASSGTIGIAGAFTPGGNIYTITGSTIDYNSAGAQTMGAFNYNNLTLSNAGVKTFSSGTTAVAAALAITGSATANATTNSSTISYNGSTAQSVAALTYYNLIATSSGSTASLSALTTVNNNLTISSGTLSANNFDMTVGGNWTNNVSPSAFTAGTGTVTLNGSGTQTLGGSNYTNFYKLTINNSAGITLGAAVAIGNTLTLTNGTVTTGGGGNHVYMGAATVTRMNGYVVGNLKKFIATGASTTKTFEIGDATSYTPLAITFNNVTTSGDLMVSTAAGDHASIGTSTIGAGKSVNRTWTLANSATVFTTYDATYTFVGADVDAGATTSSFIVGRYSGGSWTYPTVGTKTGTTTQATGLTAFGDFQLGEVTYNISGHIQNASGIAVNGATVTLSGGQAGSTTTDTSGNYSFASLSAGLNYTITPSMTNYTFAPTTLTYSSLAANQTTANFTGTSTVTYTISGHIQTASAVAIASVTVTLSGGQAGSTTTDSNGDYSFVGLPSTNNYTVTPTKANYTFSPTSLPYTNLTANQTAQNYTGTPPLKTWDGGAATNNWGDAANWNADGVPTSSDSVDLSGANTININVAAVANNVTLNNSSLVLTVNSGNSLTVSGNLTLTSGTLKTAASFPAVTGTVNVAAGTVEFTGSGTQTIPTYNYNNLTSSSTGARTLASSGTIGIAGTFTPGSNTYTITGSTVNYNASGAQTISALNYNNLTLSNAGVKTFSAGTTGVAAALAITGSATANATTNTATINYNGSTTQSVTALTYHNLTVTSAGSTVSLSGSTTVNNNLTISSGTLSANNFSMTVGGNWTNNSSTSAFTPGTATVTLNGSGTQTLGGTVYTPFQNLTISNSSGITLGGTDTVVSGTLTLTSGKVTTGANLVYMGAASSVTRTSGYVVGNLKKFIATGATVRNFEVGDASNYTPISIAFASVTTTGDITASTTASDSANIGTSTINAAKSVNRTWTLINSSTVFTTYDATYTFVSGDLDAGATTSAFIAGRYSSGSWTYPTVGTKTATTTQATGLTAFGSFQVGEVATYSISGHIMDALDSSAISGVTMTLSGGQTGTTTTDVTGNYTFAGLPAGANYTVTPSKTALTFDYTSKTFNGLAANQTANFSSIPYMIEGYIVDSQEIGIEGVTVTISGSQTGSTITGPDGYYFIEDLPAAGNYIITPSKTNYSFSPTNRTFNNLSANGYALFTGTALPVVTLVASVSPTGTVAPRTDLVYTFTFANLGAGPAQVLVTTDPIPTNTDFKISSVTTSVGTTGLTVTVAYSNNSGASWTYTPASGGGGAPAGYDRNVTHVRWSFTGSLSQAAPDNAGSVGLTARVR